MFDTTIVNSRYGGPSRIDVHEHRAPTSDTARLLNELQREAEKRIIASMPLESNLMKGAVTLYEFMMRNVYVLAANYEINGKVYNSQVERRASESRFPHQQREFLLELRDKMAQEIATDLIELNTNARIFANGPSGSL